jgi:chromosome segregation ATPase
MPEELKKLQDQVAALTSASQRLESDNAALKKQVEELTAKLSASDADLKKVNESLVHSLADRLIVVRQFVGDLPKDLEGDALKKVKDELYARSLLSIQDAIKDMEPKLRVALKPPEPAKQEPKAEPTVSKDTVAAAGTVQDPTLHDPKEPGTKPVSGRPSTSQLLGF